MALVFLGTDFHDSALSTLEFLEQASSKILRSLHQESAPLEGAIVLSTCNRFEIYCESDLFHPALEFITHAISQHVPLSPQDINEMLRVLYADAVPEHLFSVAAGLESMVVGEEEIAGQVKRALASTQKINFSTKSLNQLFQTASKVAKSVTTHTGLGASGRSIVTTALDIAQEHIDSWEHSSALVIGTGAYSRVVTTALQKRGVIDISVYSRSGRADKFAELHGIRSITRQELASEIARTHITISASGSQGYALDQDIAQQVLEFRQNTAPVVVVDVALSRDVAPELSQRPEFFIIDLERIRDNAAPEHVESLTKARQLVHSSVAEFTGALAAHSVDHVVSALRAHVGLWVDEEIENVRKKSGDETAREVQKSLRKVTNAILHTPSVKARELAVDGNQEDYIHAVRLLFDLEGAPHD